MERVKNHSDELIFHSQGLRRSAANLVGSHRRIRLREILLACLSAWRFDTEGKMKNSKNSTYLGWFSSGLDHTVRFKACGLHLEDMASCWMEASRSKKVLIIQPALETDRFLWKMSIPAILHGGRSIKKLINNPTSPWVPDLFVFKRGCRNKREISKL